MSRFFEMSSEVEFDPLPGLTPRKQWAAGTKKCDRTAKRLQDAGLLVVHYIGKTPYVDVQATAARIKGEDAKHRGRTAR
jgi:hypothetical protein